MKKEVIYLVVGCCVFQCGALMIHLGLGLMFLGALLLFGSYIEFIKTRRQ